MSSSGRRLFGGAFSPFPGSSCIVCGSGILLFVTKNATKSIRTVYTITQYWNKKRYLKQVHADLIPENQVRVWFPSPAPRPHIHTSDPNAATPQIYGDLDGYWCFSTLRPDISGVLCWQSTAKVQPEFRKPRSGLCGTSHSTSSISCRLWITWCILPSGHW